MTIKNSVDKFFRYLLVGTLGFAALTVFVTFKEPKTVAAPAPLSAAEIPNKKIKEQNESSRMLGILIVKKTLKDSLRDPTSLVYESYLTSEDGRLHCVNYRAKNGFGGYGKEFIVMEDGKASQKKSDWNKKCAKKEMYPYPVSALN